MPNIKGTSGSTEPSVVKLQGGTFAPGTYTGNDNPPPLANMPANNITTAKVKLGTRNHVVGCDNIVNCNC